MPLRLLPIFIALGLLTLLANAACEKPVDFNAIETEEELVVISNFTNDRALQVVVTKTRSIFESDEENPYVLNAEVDLFLEGGEFVESLAYNHPKNDQVIPYYSTTDFIPKPNESYLLQVSAPGYKTVTARSHIPSPIELLGVSMSDFAANEIEGTGEVELVYNLNLDFQDPDEEKNFYHISLIQELREYTLIEGDTSLLGQVMEYLLFDPRENTKERIAHLGGGILMQDDDFNGESFNCSLPVRFTYDPGSYQLGQLIVELRVVSEEYFRYFSSLSRQHAAKGEPLAEPVFVFDNVEGGKGVFAGYSGSRDSLVINR